MRNFEGYNVGVFLPTNLCGQCEQVRYTNFTCLVYGVYFLLKLLGYIYTQSQSHSITSLALLNYR